MTVKQFKITLKVDLLVDAENIEQAHIIAKRIVKDSGIRLSDKSKSAWTGVL